MYRGETGSLAWETNLEQLHSPVEEIHYLIARLIRIPVTAPRQSVDACTVFVPLVLPEMFRRAAVGQPVCAHVVQ
jgi:hypothetical protein